MATDVASRGLDIKGIGHVINMDLPKTFEDYVHRIGACRLSGVLGRRGLLARDRDLGSDAGPNGHWLVGVRLDVNVKPSACLRHVSIALHPDRSYRPRRHQGPRHLAVERPRLLPGGADQAGGRDGRVEMEAGASCCEQIANEDADVLHWLCRPHHQCLSLF